MISWIAKPGELTPAQSRRRAFWFSGVIAVLGIILLTIATAGLSMH